MRVSVVIPVKDDERVVDCVRSIQSLAGEAASLHVIVVDNGSAAAFRARLGDLPGLVTVLDEERPGAYAARNRALDAVTADVVLFTDADCLARPGWVAEALRNLEAGADIVQGYSGSIGRGPVERLIQRRYAAHLLRLRPGDPTECDTRNLAVHRRVFEALRFNDRYRRVGDTEFGLLAEDAGFRVVYCPAMRVDHAHERDLALFLAKQICHGWGAQRLMQEHPGLRWHGGHLRAVARVTRWSARLPGHRIIARALASTALSGGRALQTVAHRLPELPAFWALTVLDKLAALSGHLMFEAGASEPSPSDILSRRLPRD